MTVLQDNGLIAIRRYFFKNFSFITFPVHAGTKKDPAGRRDLKTRSNMFN
jgi:hypothetical protein